MRDYPHLGIGAVPLSQVQLVDRVCDRFEAACKIAGSAGRRPRIEDFLAEVPEPERSALLGELIPLEITYRRLGCDDPRPEDYQARFPALDPEWLASTCAASADGGASPSPAPARPATQAAAVTGHVRVPRVEHLRCPHCHHPISWLDDQASDVLCQGCGSSIQLLRDTRLTTTLNETRLLGKFQLLERVGIGAFGAVWRARDTELDRIVAVKLPHANLLTSPADVQRFHREARAAAQLRHPGIVTVYEVTTLEGSPAIVSEFVDGVPLKDLIEARRLTFRETAALLAEVAEALDYAHSLGLVHRDIKPANIMVESVVRSRSCAPGKQSAAATDHGRRTTGGGHPKVVDFGLALREDVEIAMTVDGQIMGTPAYMSPEQAVGEGHRVDGRSDIYSLGVVLYELLCGELPFRGSKAMLVQQVRHEEPRPPRRVNDTIPRDLETICLKALAKEPARRYLTARALAEDLRRWHAGEPIRARRVSAWERGVSWCRRRPAIAACLALIVLITALGFGGITWKWREAEDQKQQTIAALVQQEITLYFNRIALAQQELSAGNGGRAAELLDECPERLRGWEWHYLQRQRYGGPLSYQHTAVVRCVAFSPDGRYLAAAGVDKTVTVRDATTGETVHTLQGHAATVAGVAFSRDGKRLASGSADGGVKVWDTTTGKEPVILSRHTRGVNNLAFSADGQLLASASNDRTVKVWDVTTGELVHDLKGHADRVMGVAFRPDGGRLISADGEGTVKVWDLATGLEASSLQIPIRWVLGTAFSRDGERFALASRDGTLKVCEAATGREVHTLPGHTGYIYAMAFSPDGRRLVSVGYDKTVKVWDMASGQEALTLRGHTSLVWDVAFSPDGRRLATGSADNTVRVWDATPLTEEEEHRQVFTLAVHRQRVLRVAFSPDSKRLAAGSWDGSVRVWDVSTGRRGNEMPPPLLSLAGHQAPVLGLAYSADGRCLASGGWDGNVKVWDAATGQEIDPLASDSQDGLASDSQFVWGVAYSHDGLRLAAGCQNTVKVWDTKTRHLALTLADSLPQQAAPVMNVAYSPDGRRLATAHARTRHNLTVWDATTGKEIRTLQGHTGLVWSVAFSPR
ncbi:MAG TPA: protein kinase [Gemmataceae bacterium]|nr:protein kinase [Gemmataceae bacterium]